MNRILLILIFSFAISNLWSQLSGTINDENGEALPYANIFLKNSSQGTTSNINGQYELKLPEGEHTIVYQYIGYETAEVDVVIIQDQPVIKNIQLGSASYTMPEITINANSEDPAYAIIRKAQEKRKYYKEQNSVYSCDAYVRGFNKIFSAPEKIMGIDIGDLDGALDTSRQGVIYLSESVSKLYVKGSKSKEIMYSSKVSGNDQGYSFNSAREMEFDFYDNNLDINRKIISPIASNAFSVYDYKLEGARIDEYGNLVNKIKVIPKNEYAPVFSGYIYINEELWNINSADLYLSSKASQLPFIDSLNFKQSYNPIHDNRWVMFSNIVRFKMSAFGFTIGGNFACVYSNYILDQIDESVFNNEVYVVESEANTRSREYWDTIRPIPLTKEESLDYQRKDSIQLVRESPEYKDSIDRENNKLTFGKLISSYSIQNSHKRTRWQFESPLSSVSVNTIQGWNGSFKFSYQKDYNRLATKKLELSSRIEYGASDKIWRPRLDVDYLANQRDNLRFSFSIGKDLSQFNRVEPITDRLNAIMSLFFRRNYLKAYDKEFTSFSYQQDISNIFRLRSSIDFENRNSVSNNYDGSVFYKNSRSFTENIALSEKHQSLILRLSLRIKPGEKVISYPDRKFKAGSDWPSIWLYYKKALPGILGSDTDFDLIHASISDSYSLGIWGEFDFYIHGGIFLNKPQYFVDHFHFLGNQTHLGYPPRYNYSFLMMPYYDLSTDNDFVQYHLQHNFKGSLLSRIPLVRRLNWHLAGGYKYLQRQNNSDYSEWFVGIDNIGFGLFRLLRLDLVWSQSHNLSEENIDYSGFGILVGLKINI